MDHEHYDWSPISTRGRLRWPDDARLALGVIVTLEHMEWQAPEGSFQVANLAGGSAVRPFPDYARISHREYGHRVGIFRVLDVLEKHGIKATVAMDALTAENYPFLVRHCQERGCEIIGHGISVSRMITSNMSEAEESAYLQESLSAMRRATGSTPAGWLGPEYGESTRTPQLLAQAGIRYVCDWGNDDQPYPMKAPVNSSVANQGGQSLLALPVTHELDDIGAMAQRLVTPTRYGQLLQEAFDTLYDEGANQGRLLLLNLHPWLVGQPFRIGYLDAALGHMVRRRGVWAATGSEITDWYHSNPPANRPEA
jgi:peptidoglycan/xylan/chitin deacetylase (PgdA/CDA1 family)